MSFRKTISWCLFPLTMWYGIVVGIRNMLFSAGLRQQRTTPVTTIGVGNLTTGGTGKTPHVEYLLRLLGESYPTAFLSRGYKRRTKGYLLADEGHADATALGDEPAMIARKFPHVRTAVCEKRNEGIRQLLSLDEPPQLVVLDDVYQHRQVKPTINMLLTEYGKPYYDDHVLPFGDLRESRSGADRANIIIVTKSPENLNPIYKHNIIQSLKARPYQKVFFSYLKYGLPTALDGSHTLGFRDFDSVLVVTGIAHPNDMVKFIEKRCRKNKSLRFADHHNYTAGDLQEMRNLLEKLSGQRKIILTTEKDAARLRSFPNQEAVQALPFYYLPIEVAFHDHKDYSFDDTIRSLIKENISFLGNLNASKNMGSYMDMKIVPLNEPLAPPTTAATPQPPEEEGSADCQ